MELRANNPSCDTGPWLAVRTYGETAVAAPFGLPVREQLKGARSLRAAWDDYQAQVSGLCAAWAECGWSAAWAGKDGTRRGLAADVAEQHDALIRRLGDWPAIDVWNADLAVAVRAAEAQLASLLSAGLGQGPARATAHERTRMALAAGDIRRLGQALSALRPALCAVEPTDD
jgi:hypothetical protein